MPCFRHFSHLILVLNLFLVGKVHALYSVMDTGDLLEEGSFRANVETQFAPNNDNHLNLTGRFDSWYKKDANLRGVVGFGASHLYLGTFYKWVPYPDVEGQPAMGLTGGVTYVRYKKANKKTFSEVSVRIHPLVSKSFQINNIGKLTPYGSIPFAIAYRSGGGRKIIFPVQLVAGMEWENNYWDQLTFSTEVGFNMNEAFSYFSVGAQLYFNEENLAWRK